MYNNYQIVFCSPMYVRRSFKTTQKAKNIINARRAFKRNNPCCRILDISLIVTL